MFCLLYKASKQAHEKNRRCIASDIHRGGLVVRPWITVANLIDPVVDGFGSSQVQKVGDGRSDLARPSVQVNCITHRTKQTRPQTS